MIRTKGFECVFAQLGLRCPTAAAEDVKNPAGEAPSMEDTVLLHVRLPYGSDVRTEVEERICPALGETEQYLDESEEEKPGSFRTVVSRKKWGQYLMVLATKLDGERLQPVLRMEGASLQGKPMVNFYKDVEPVLVFQLRGKLTDPQGETSDQIRRRYVHFRLFCSLDAQQTALTDDEQRDLDEAAGVAGADGTVAGDQQVGTRPDALPEHSFTSQVVAATCARMESQFPGFTWDAIRIRQRSKPSQPVTLGWAEVTQCAASKNAVADMKAARQEAEAAVAAQN